MEKLISSETKKVGNKIIETRVYEKPLYELRKTQADYWWDSGEFEEYLINRQIVSYSPTYKWLTSPDCSFSSDSRNANEVLELFTKYVKKTHKDYNVYVLQEYRHSGSCFHLTETTTRIDRWDSGIVGFMALPKDVDSVRLGNMITDVYEGTIDVYEVVNNETDDVEDSYEYWLNTDSIDAWNKMEKEIKDKYGIDLDDLED